MTDWSRISRKKQTMPGFVCKALLEGGLSNAFQQRPAYQQNDYLSWIKRAKRKETTEKRLNQLIEELRSGDTYMNMYWKK
jgi:uncharacterized protein YdeI (YjbR/CyaY-like superfamily)